MGFGGSEFWTGARLMLPIAFGGLLEGAAFGALAATVIGHVEPVLMSATAFSGSAQWATLAVLRDDGTLAAALLAAASLNARYLAMSATVALAVEGSRRRTAATCLLLTDAAWAVVSAKPSRARLAGAGATDLVGWTAGTAIGALAGGTIADPQALGLDAAFPALFVALLALHLRDAKGSTGVIAAVAGAALALVLAPIAPPGVPILAAGLTVAAYGALR